MKTLTFSDWYVDNMHLYNQYSTRSQIAEAYAKHCVEQSEQSRWISVEGRLPESHKTLVIGLYQSHPRRCIPAICFYTVGREVEFEDYEDDYESEDNEYESEKGALFLKKGWYEEVEQINSMYDNSYLSRKITHWMPLPEPPTKNQP